MQKILQNISGIEKLSEFNHFFYKKEDFITIENICQNLQIINENDLDKNTKIYNVKIIEEAGQNDLTFFSNIKYLEKLKETRASFCIIDEKYAGLLPENIIPIVVKNPHYAYTIILDMLYLIPSFVINPKISEKAHINVTAKIGSNVEIQAGVYIDEGVIIGDNCKICANTVINRKCIVGNNTYIGANSTISYSKIGSNVVINNNVSIGQCGFGFANENGFNYKIPQIGMVEIGDFVEIGSCTTIDRGAQSNTTIEKYTKIDNLVQIAHGVKIGIGCFLASQVGIAGSTTIGNYVQLGGKAGIAGHIKIDDMAQVAANSGVMKNIKKGEIVGGSPSLPIKEWHRTTILLKKLLNTK